MQSWVKELAGLEFMGFIKTWGFNHNAKPKSLENGIYSQRNTVENSQDCTFSQTPPTRYCQIIDSGLKVLNVCTCFFNCIFLPGIVLTLTFRERPSPHYNAFSLWGRLPPLMWRLLIPFGKCLREAKQQFILLVHSCLELNTLNYSGVEASNLVKNKCCCLVWVRRQAASCSL